MMEKMQQKLMKRYQMFAWLGFSVVVVAFLFSLQGSGANDSADKATREAARAGSALVAANVLRHSILTWVPALKFVGLGILLGASTIILRSAFMSVHKPTPTCKSNYLIPIRFHIEFFAKLFFNWRNRT